MAIAFSVRGEKYGENQISDCDMVLEGHVIGEQLSVDTLDFTVQSDGSRYDTIETADAFLFANENGDFYQFKCTENSDLMAFSYGDPVDVLQDGEQTKRFYLESVKRTGEECIAHSCISAVGLLDAKNHSGGIYRGETLLSVAQSIVGSIVPLRVDASVQGTLVYGWLPYDTCRNNLSQLLFASGTTLQSNADGSLAITYVNTDVSRRIEYKNLFTGGDYQNAAPATGVDVTEHSFLLLESDKEAALFDNTDGSGAANHTLVTFSNPCHDLVVDGLILEESGVNYALVSGTGTLTGKEFTHQTKIVSKRLDHSAAQENIITVTDATLINVLNADSIAKRVLDYKSKGKTVGVDFVYQGETPSDYVQLFDAVETPYGGVLTDMDISFGGFLRAKSNVLVDYMPPTDSGQYTHRAILTEAQIWTLPQDVERFKVVLIGGGTGGTAGQDGQAGTTGNMKFVNDHVTTFEHGDGGTGGKGGVLGIGGNLYAQNIANPSDRQVTVTIGNGGTAVAYGAEQIAGEETTCQIGDLQLSSAHGLPTANGFLDVMTGTIYGVQGELGYDGADGADGGGSSSNYAQAGEVGEDSDTAKGGLGGSGAGVGTNRHQGASGGGGAGAAHQTNGGKGTDAICSLWDGGIAKQVIGGSGGAGACPPNGKDGMQYGDGGSAGHGGGGGGGAGAAMENDEEGSCNPGSGGTAGKGSAGGAGNQGCVIIYY